MKTIKWFLSAALAFGLFVPVVKGFIFTIDGTADPGYGSAVSTQAIGTSAGDNTETNQGLNLGSELDAAYGVISNGVLYLVVAGNFSSDPLSDNDINNETHVFFMSDSVPAGENILQTNFTAYSPDGPISRLDAMGVNGGTLNTGGAGLTFDANFAPNYWIGFNVGEPTPPNGTPPVMYVDYQQMYGDFQPYFLGNVTATNTYPNNSFTSANVGQASGIEIAILTTNIGGVDGTTCATNAEGQLQSVNAATVRTGVELAIPLAALGNPTGKVLICTFVTDQFCDTIFNQVLGPVWDGTSTYCNGQLANGDPSEVNFSTLPGQHYFTLTVPPCSSIGLSTASTTLPVGGGSSNVVVTMSGGCSWTASLSTNWLTINSGSIGTGDGTITYTATANLSISPRTATLTIVGSAQFLTNTVTITELGSTLPPLNSFVVDGTLDPLYGCPISVQQIGTGYGKTTNNTLAAAGGSELDAAYGMIQDGILNLFFAGNLQDNGNHLHVFFMTAPPSVTGCPNTITNIEPSVDFDNINLGFTSTNAGSPGLTFDTGFNPNYWIGMVYNGGSPPTLFVNYAQLWPGATNSAGLATNGYFLGQCNATNGTLFGATNPFGVQVAINDSNTNGVDGSSCVTNTTVGSPGFGQLNSVLALAVTNGIELAIPLGAIGNPTGQIAVCAFVGGGGYQFMSNQILGPINPNGTTNSYCGWPDFGNAAAVNLSTLPGQHYFLVGPEMRVTGISIPSGTTNVVISYQTENNTNLFYRLERTTSPLTIATTNPAVWTPVTGNIAGTNVTITVTDTKAATNKPALFYRVQQTPACTP
jgi:hypothetical protein